MRPREARGPAPKADPTASERPPSGTHAFRRLPLSPRATSGASRRLWPGSPATHDGGLSRLRDSAGHGGRRRDSASYNQSARGISPTPAGSDSPPLHLMTRTTRKRVTPTRTSRRHASRGTTRRFAARRKKDTPRLGRTITASTQSRRGRLLRQNKTPTWLDTAYGSTCYGSRFNRTRQWAVIRVTEQRRPLDDIPGGRSDEAITSPRTFHPRRSLPTNEPR